MLRRPRITCPAPSHRRCRSRRPRCAACFGRDLVDLVLREYPPFSRESLQQHSRIAPPLDDAQPRSAPKAATGPRSPHWSYPRITEASGALKTRRKGAPLTHPRGWVAHPSFGISKAALARAPRRNQAPMAPSGRSHVHRLGKVRADRRSPAHGRPSGTRDQLTCESLDLAARSKRGPEGHKNLKAGSSRRLLRSSDESRLGKCAAQSCVGGNEVNGCAAAERLWVCPSCAS